MNDCVCGKQMQTVNLKCDIPEFDTLTDITLMVRYKRDGKDYMYNAPCLLIIEQHGEDIKSK